jgi:plastocyanin
MRVRWKIGIACGLVAGGALVALLATSGREAAAAAPAADYGDGATVAMKDNDFRPQTLTVAPGTEVRWPNQGRTDHNVIPDERAQGWQSKTVKPGRTFRRTFTEPGVVGYYCSFHGAPGRGMYGTLIVTNADGTLPAAAHNRSRTPTRTRAPKTIRVPQDQPRIQAAVDRAVPGDLILVKPGVYREAVTVTTDRLVIRGLDRNRVVLDGGYKLDNGIRVLEADGVAVENMTARRYTRNGFFWTGATGYRGEYLTTTRTGDYGIYAFDSTDGIFRHAFASGAPDAGFYIGQCYPCNALIDDVTAEWNGLGYSGTNAGGNLVITRSVWRKNRAGIVPNSGDGELNPPERETTVVGNLVYDNNNDGTPAIDAAILAQYNGIAITGGNDNLVLRNRVIDHDYVGIGILPNPDKTVWISNRNQVRENVVSGSGLADLGLLGGTGNCFAGNTFKTSKPAAIETALPCPNTVAAGADQLPADPFLSEKPPSVAYQRAKTPKPPRLRGMRRPARAPARPAVGIVVAVDVDAIPVPPAP